MWTTEIPVITTGHISVATRDLLHSVAADQCKPSDGITDVAEYTSGFFVRFCEETPLDNPDMQAIRDWLDTAGYDLWVRIDSDGDTVPGLPIYEW